MAEETTEKPDEPAAEAAAPDTAPKTETQAAASDGGKGTNNDIYFSNGNKLLTLPG